MVAKMTSRRHSRSPLRRSSAPERILSAGLATATCVGIVGLVGARTIEANTTESAAAQSSVDTSAVASTVEPVAAVVAEPTTASGLTEADLDAYATQLAVEKDRLDAYRAKLVKTAKKLQRLAAQRSQAVAAPAQAPSQTSRPASKPASRPASKPAAKPVSKPAAKPVSKPVAKPAAKPAPQPAAAPQAAPAPAPAAKPQSNTKTS
jgi:hypothetical protein